MDIHCLFTMFLVSTGLGLGHRELSNALRRSMTDKKIGESGIEKRAYFFPHGELGESKKLNVTLESLGQNFFGLYFLRNPGQKSSV